MKMSALILKGSSVDEGMAPDVSQREQACKDVFLRPVRLFEPNSFAECCDYVVF
jgi:hypothetical protein